MFMFSNSPLGFLVGLLIAGVAAWWGYNEAPKRGQNSFLWAAIGVFFPLGVLGLLFFSGGSSADGRPRAPAVADWPPPGTRADYVHAFKDTAIAVDRENRLVHLRSMFAGQRLEKTYSFSDIRSWRTNIATGGTFVGQQSVATAAHNYMTQRKNEEESGLFVEVRDIDCPEWRIGFKADKHRELTLKRWMEILRQIINE